MKSPIASIVQRGLSLNKWPLSIIMRDMVINMNDEQLHTLADLQAFLTGTVAMNFTVTTDQRYEFIARTVGVSAMPD
ncbi:MAG: hypothetical protein NTY60_00655 [Proteobacteria bacterium]|nr:hypothetical protein [Pseudomonadota bacterium]